MPGSEQLDVAELAASLVGEVRAGVTASAAEHRGHLEVVTATIRVGQDRADADTADVDTADVDTADAGAPGEAGSPLIARPGATEHGWQVELTLTRDELGDLDGPGPGVDGELSPTSTAGPASAVGLWRGRPLVDLKGVDTVRARVLGAEGVDTIGDLLDLDEAAIAAVVARRGSHRYLDAWVLADLLRVPAPILGRSPADGDRLATLAGTPPDQLRARLDPRVCSRSAATALFDLLAVWGLALDRRAMAAVTLGELRAATRPDWS